MILPLAVGAFTVPFILRTGGVEFTGILTLLWALIGYFSLFDFGLGRILTQQIATKRGSSSPATDIQRIAGSGLLLTGVAGSVGGVVLYMLAPMLGGQWMNVSPALQVPTVKALQVTAIGIPMAAITSGLRGVIEAYEEFATISLLRVTLGFANFGFPALSLIVFGPNIAIVAASLVAARLLVLLPHALVMLRLVGVDLSLRRDDISPMFALLTAGGYMTLSNVISPLMVVADRFFISFLLGADVVAYYTVPFEVLFRLLMIPGALTAALFPRLTLQYERDVLEFQATYRASYRTVAKIMFPLCTLAAGGAYLALQFWLGENFAEQSWAVASVLAVGVFVNGLAQVPLCALHARGMMRRPALGHLVEAVIYVPVLIICLANFGILGAAIAWTARACGDFIFLYCSATVLLKGVGAKP